MADPVKQAEGPKEAVPATIPADGAVSIAQNAPGEEIKTEVAPVPTKNPEERQTGKEEVYAYTLREPAFGELQILNSANAWWLDRLKVQKLIDAYKIDATDEQAMFYAGISKGQFEYFKKLHPDFSGVKEACGQHLGLLAKMAIAKEIEHNQEGRPSWYLERIEKNRYSTRTEHTGADGKNLIPLSEEQESKIQALAGIVAEQNDNQGPSTIPTNSDTPRA